MVTREEYVQGLHEVFDPIGRDVAECKQRLRGGDTAPGQRHEFMDMLQGIDADAHDTQYRVRGGDTAEGQRHAGFDMLQGIDYDVQTLAGQVNHLYSNEVIEGQPYTKTAANFNDTRAIGADVTEIKDVVVR